MESSSLSILLLFSLLLLFNIPHSHSFNSKMQPKCHEKEMYVLLEFKATFYNRTCDYYEGANLKTWTVEGKNGDCCNWDGVECDELSSHVIGLYPCFSCLSGPINSSSSIFKLIHLKRLDLSGNDFHYSKIPSAITNLSRLESLNLYRSNFSGQIPSEILHLTNLSALELGFNQLTLMNPNLRDLVQTLVKLEFLDLTSVEISSSIPNSLSRLTSLQYLFLCGCNLKGQIPPSMENLTSLESLDLSENNLEGEIFSNLTNLYSIDLSNNQFTGEIFPQLLRFTKLVNVFFSFNNFFGQIPRTISHLKNLTCLSLDSNNFSGKMPLDAIFQLDGLKYLDLSYNNFSLVIDSIIKPGLKLEYLGLTSCNLRSFPLLLKSQDALRIFNLSANEISGEVPQWFRDVKMENLEILDLSHNHLSGSLPIPSTNSSLHFYSVSHNKFSGELPPRICDLVNISVFDSSNNNLSGMIPQCLSNLVGMGSLSVLNLHNNGLRGPIPKVGKNGCSLVMIDMSYNRLKGPIPRDLKYCTNLEFLNLGNNKIVDVFPFWLGRLPTLSVLILRSNRFHGIIHKPSGGYEFPELKIIELSNNNFIGHLSAQYFEGWKAMKVGLDKEDQAMSYASYGNGSYYYIVTVTNKGINVEYSKIPESLMGIDLSNNYFTGQIPKSIANLKGLHFMNLSNNMLTGPIPLSLNGLTNLESLDLSHNKLSGEIPQQLTDLTALSCFDVSFNQLTGPIPQSKQFWTFENSSYKGNSGLCGLPLSRKCGNIVEASPPPSLEKNRALGTWIEINWIIVSLGYASGFVIGVVVGMNWTSGCKRVKSFRQIKFILS